MIWIGVAVLILLLVGPRAVSLTTDWLWFSDIGYTEVFSTIIWTRIIVFLVAAVLTAAIVFAAVAVAYRSRSVFVPSGIGPDPLARYRTTVMARIRWFAVLPPLLIGVLAGLVAQGSWSTVQVFLKGTSFGVKDPQFGLDVGFYAFDLPFWRFLLNLLFVIVVVAFVVNLVTHYVFGSIRLGGGGVFHAQRIGIILHTLLQRLNRQHHGLVNVGFNLLPDFAVAAQRNTRGKCAVQRKRHSSNRENKHPERNENFQQGETVRLHGMLKFSSLISAVRGSKVASIHASPCSRRTVRGSHRPVG